MRILLIDIDSLRPDRLGCYGYHRDTSPTIDRLAAEGLRLEHCYASDVPCCPSRSSLFSCRYGYRHGAVGHRGSRATPWVDPQRGFVDQRDRQSFPALLRHNDYRCAFISSFPTRHSAWHSLAGFHDWIDTGEHGHEIAPTVHAAASDWLERHGRDDDWFCHVTFWDVHTGYRTPADYGEPFADDQPPAWPDAATLARHVRQPGIRSAMDSSWSKGGGSHGGRQPVEVDSPEKLRRFQNGYDTAVRYVDDHVAKLMAQLDELGITDDTAIIITADHGEDMGEFNAYGSHCFCGPAVARVPMIVRWPGQAPQVLDGVHQHFDVFASCCERLGIERPETWDAQPFSTHGRPYAVSSMLAQGVQRAVYWQAENGSRPQCYLRTWADLMHGIPEECVIAADDPHCLQPQTEGGSLDLGRHHLSDWLAAQEARSAFPDPLEQVLSEKTDVMRRLERDYRQRLVDTGRSDGSILQSTNRSHA